jgi:hypothetical protein
MKVKNEFFETLTDLKPIMEKDFTARTAYWLAKVIQKVETEANAYFTQKQKLIEKYAAKDENGKMVSLDGGRVKLEDSEKFQAEFKELLEIEVDFGIEKIPFDLDREPGMKIPEMNMIIPFIEVKHG